VIKKRGRFYWLDFRIGKRRIRRSLGTDEHGLALDRARQIKEQLLLESQQSGTSFDTFARKYLDWAWVNKPASANREQQRIEMIRAFLKEHNLSFLEEINPWHIENLKAWLKARGRSGATINRYLQLLRGMFYKAIDWEIIKGPNPVRKVKFFKEAAEKRLLKPEEIEKILAVAKEISEKPYSLLQARFYDILLFAMNTGMRKSEILNLKWKDISPGVARVIGKGNKARIVPLNETARQIIERQPRRDEYVFYIPNRHQPDLFRRTTQYIKKKTGIDFHFHLLRHYFASTLLARGVDIITVAELLGHSRASTSLIYSHTSLERKASAVATLDTLPDTGRGTYVEN